MKNLFKSLAAAAALLWAATGGVLAQSSPNLITGQVPTAAQWNSYFAAKQDVLGYVPLNRAGGAMTGGPLAAFASSATVSGFRLNVGVAPTTPTNGDLWTTTAGLYVRIAGTTIGPLSGATSSSFAGTSPIGVTFPSGVVTYAFDFTVANSWLATQTFRTLLAGTTNTYDIGTNATTAAFRTIYAGTSFVGPAGTFTTSAAVGGCTLGGNAFCVTGSAAISSTLTSTAHAITSASANALVVGPSGATNPTFQVDASTTSAATGLKVKSAPAAGGLALSVITSGTNENLTIDAAGAGTITFGGTSTGAITLTRATTLSAALTYGGVTFANAVTGSGNLVGATAPTVSALTVTGSFTATGLVTLADHATQGANTFIANVTSGTASPTAAAIPSCTGAAAALQYTSGTGLGCGTITASASAITVGSTTVLSGTTTRILYDNAGVLGEYTISGTGTVVAMTASPTFTGTPILSTPTATSIAVGGCTISTNAFCATGHLLLEGVTSTGATGTGNLVFATAPSVSSLTVTTAFTATGLVTLPALATQTAYTLLGNFTGSAASPTASAPGSLTHKASPATTDILLLQDQAASGQLKYCTLAECIAAVSSGVTTFNTLSGAVTTSVVKQTFCASGCTTTVAGGSTGTYTPTSGMLHAIIECVGSGGGGGGAGPAVASIFSAGGGGGGSYSRKYTTAAAVGASQTVTIGAAGTAGSAGNNVGGGGGDVSVGTLCVGKGGSGGGGSDVSTVGTPGAGGVAGTGDVTGRGEAGQAGFYNSANGSIVAFFGAGGNGVFGGGGNAVSAGGTGATAGNAGNNYGGGGSGGYANQTASSAAGGAGFTGIVIITEFVNL